MRSILVLSMTIFGACQAAASEPVMLDTMVRAETAANRGTLKLTGGLGKLAHLRQPTSIDKRTIIRMNRDTLYSAAILGLSKPVAVIIPQTGGRYLSMHVINQDHDIYAVWLPILIKGEPI